MAKMSWHEACQLDNSLTALDHFFPVPPSYAQTLTGGLTNRCWKVVLSNEDAFVWRPTTPITKAFSISRFQEYQILNSIEESQIGPKPITVNDQGLLVSWIEGKALTSGLAFNKLLDVMVNIHSLNTNRLPVAPFNYTARVDHYWMMLEEHYKTSDNQTLYQRFRSAPSLKDVGSVLCHFDLAGYNMVETIDGTKVIDWEYATLADPRLDLTLSIDVAEQDPTESVVQYCHRRDIADIEPWLEGVKEWKPRATMMALLWYLLAHQLWGDEQYLIQAEKLKQLLCN